MYRGRFAPSPTGALHEGSLVAALASWLDARAHGGAWLVRIEDVDRGRCSDAHAHTILAQLAACGLTSDEPVLWQSAREGLYGARLDALVARGLAYPCGCTRQDIEQALAAAGRLPERHGERVYPGTCRHGLGARSARAWRFRAEGAAPVEWLDRRAGVQRQDVARAVGDFVLRRADGGSSYQLAVVADDDAQRITDVVRGEDLADNTPRQILLQRALGAPTPRYLHVPLVRAADGCKLSKQNGAAPLDLSDAPRALRAAARHLGLAGVAGACVGDVLAQAVPAWQALLASWAAPNPPTNPSRACA